MPPIVGAKLGFLVGKEQAFACVHGDELFDLVCQLSPVIERQFKEADQREDQAPWRDDFNVERVDNRKIRTGHFFGIFQQRIAPLHMSKRRA